MPKTFVDPSETIGSRQVGIRIGNTLDEARESIGEIIRAPTTITEPGNYILGNDINGTIVIAEENVWLNLNGYTIFESTGTSTGIVINAGARDITIINGNIDGNQFPSAEGAIGILINEAELVNIENVYILDFPKGTGISINGKDSTFPVKGCNIKNCIVSNCHTGIVANHIVNSTFENVEIKDGFKGGIDIYKGYFNFFYLCKALNIYDTTDEVEGAFGFRITGYSSNNLFKECIARYIMKSEGEYASAIGFYLGANSNEIVNCTASAIGGKVSAIGIFAEYKCIIRNNIVQGLAGKKNAHGIYAKGSCKLEHNTVSEIPYQIRTRQRSIHPIPDPVVIADGPEKAYGIYLFKGNNIIRNNIISHINWQTPTGTGGEAYGIYAETDNVSPNVFDGNTISNIWKDGSIGIKHGNRDVFIRNISFNNDSDFDPAPSLLFNLSGGGAPVPYANLYR